MFTPFNLAILRNNFRLTTRLSICPTQAETEKSQYAALACLRKSSARTELVSITTELTCLRLHCQSPTTVVRTVGRNWKPTLAVCFGMC